MDAGEKEKVSAHHLGSIAMMPNGRSGPSCGEHGVVGGIPVRDSLMHELLFISCVSVRSVQVHVHVIGRTCRRLRHRAVCKTTSPTLCLLMPRCPRREQCGNHVLLLLVVPRWREHAWPGRTLEAVRLWRQEALHRGWAVSRTTGTIAWTSWAWGYLRSTGTTGTTRATRTGHGEETWWCRVGAVTRLERAEEIIWRWTAAVHAAALHRMRREHAHRRW